METKTETIEQAKNDFEHFVETVLVRSGRDRMFLADHVISGHEALVEDIIQWPHMHKTGTSTKTIEDLENISRMAKHMANLMRMKEDGAFARDDYLVAYDSEWKGHTETEESVTIKVGSKEFDELFPEVE
jgi:hypothetical protein